MINFRRVFAFLAMGGLLLVAVGAQAGAVGTDTASLAIAERGLALGSRAADDIASDAEDGVLVGGDIGKALEVWERVIARLESKSNRGNGRGPEGAIAVHNALLAGVLPSSLGRSGDGIPELAKAYGHLRAELENDSRPGRAVGPYGVPPRGKP